MDSVQTPKGTDLPLITLKGKKYLQVAHRLIWFNEVVENFEIQTEFLMVTDEQTIAKATVKVFNKDGKVIKQSQATKRETKKDFSDHTEKAETSAIGRALALLGFGTQFALADLEEGERLADSPVVDTKVVEKPVEVKPVEVKPVEPTMKKELETLAKEEPKTLQNDDWGAKKTPTPSAKPSFKKPSASKGTW